ncbi:GPO family capsid scaffolding protein [Vibrio sp. SCSIO 43133]|uniref:GPO family capsid scaffolding protein n=1 Tax=Vibrio sp. SCSIO 43133 TaxID=2802577 RepID=UPI0020751428|nr:GPO family capsid scaffolding protein [Vibrio sp. SCSIO 43133]USE04041.1 GPO family capsid scaffolding protein [Vibrio sp. SCSIO 43133]
MFKSEPICILKAGPTVDGRNVPQQVIDDIADTYDPKKYNALINEEHFQWSWKYGSVLSAEKRNDELWAVIKPNSMLLRTVENGQLLHTSVEYQEDFGETGKAYLTGLALTDNPASLGTTQIQLSNKSADKTYVSTGQTVNLSTLSGQNPEQSEQGLFKQFKSWLKGEGYSEQLSQKQEPDEMSKKTEELLEQSIEQNKELSNQLGQLVTCLSAQSKQDGDQETPPEEGDEVTELKGQVENLSTQVGELKDQLQTLSKQTDEHDRKPAGSDGEETPYL